MATGKIPESGPGAKADRVALERLRTTFPELGEVLLSIDRRLGLIEQQLSAREITREEARSSVELSMIMSSDDPLAAIQERNKRVEQRSRRTIKMNDKCNGNGRSACE